MSRGLERMMRDAEAWQEVVDRAAQFKDEQAHLQHLTEQLRQLLNEPALGEEWLQVRPGEWVSKLAERENND